MVYGDRTVRHFGILHSVSIKYAAVVIKLISDDKGLKQRPTKINRNPGRPVNF